MKIKFFVFILFIMIFFTGFHVNAASSDSSLEFVLTRVVELGDYKYITIEVTNESNEEYSFGWVNSCYLEVITEDGIFKEVISGGTIKKETKKYDYYLKAPGNIKTIRYTDIRTMNGRLPLSSSSTVFSVEVSSYYKMNGTNVLIMIGATLGALFIFIIFLRIKKGSKVTRVVGNIIYLLSIITLVYAGYCFVVKPTLGQADFSQVAKKYWYLWIIGMILAAVGQKLRKKKLNKKTSNYNHNDMLIRQQLQINEQNRLFQEQFQRDMEQAQRDAQQAMDQAQRDAQQAMDQMNQQQFNDFNNNNMNGMF